MSPRLLLLLAMVVSLLLVLFALVRWGESWRLQSQRQQQLAQRDALQNHPGMSGSLTTPLLSQTSPQASLSQRSVQPRTPLAPSVQHTVQTKTPIVSKVVRYLDGVQQVEQSRQQTWSFWWQQVAPPEPLPTPDPNNPSASREKFLPDLLQAATQWDHQLSGSLPDSTCLPFHLAYLGYLALEKDYIRRLVVAQQQGDLAECLRLQREQASALRAAAQRVQAKLRNLQHDHPELSTELRGLQIHTGAGTSTDIR